jgi:hypothetical protein
MEVASMKAEEMTVHVRIKIGLEVSFWDALKMRLMGRIPAARLLTHILQNMRRAA